MSAPTIGHLVHDFFLEYLAEQKGLRRSSLRSYRDTLRLFLPFTARHARKPITRLALDDLTLERVLAFLKHLEHERGNAIATRNQRLAALRTWFEYLARRCPEALRVAQQIAAIPTKRTAQPDTRFIPRDDVERLFRELPERGRLALRDRALLLFLYNSGARVQEVAELRVEHLALAPPASVRLLGKGGKWRCCPLWPETAALLTALIEARARRREAPVFVSASGAAMTRFGLYKRVRVLTAGLTTRGVSDARRPISPHVWRHTAAVHLLESGVDVNVIRGWLGHASLNTTHRYAEITMKMKRDAMQLCAPGGIAPIAPWQNDPSLMGWLAAL